MYVKHSVEGLTKTVIEVTEGDFAKRATAFGESETVVMAEQLNIFLE